MKKSIVLALISAGVLTLTACTGQNSTTDSFSVAENAADSNFSMSKDWSYDDYGSPASESVNQSEADIVKASQMIIRDASLQVDAENLELFDKSLHETVASYDGYFESSEINNYSSEYSTTRYSYYTIRIPNTKLDDFLGIIDQGSSITSKSITTQDVSLDYIDVKAHIQSLETEMETLNRLKVQAENVADLIEIENRISEVQYQLDSANGQKRYLEGRVGYSTVNITACEERNIEHPIKKAFSVNFKEKMLEGMETAVTTLVGIITSIPVIIIVTSFILLFIWILRKVWRKIFKKKDNIKYVMVPIQSEMPSKADDVSTLASAEVQSDKSET